MSTVSLRPPSKSPPPPEPNPFRYGWRYITVTQPDGTVVLDQVPLTLEDVLHPEAGDIILQSDPHDSDLAYLKDVFKVQVRENPAAVVLSDCQVDFNIPGVKPLCPDVALFFGVRRRIEWTSFDVAQEGARAALVVEETSPDTRVNDVETKVDYYHRAQVPWYVIADVSYDENERRQIELILYRWRPEDYERIAADEQGRVWLEPVGLWLGLTRDPEDGFIRLACFDRVTGREVGDYAAIWRALNESQALRADAERRAEEEAQARADAERAAPTPNAPAPTPNAPAPTPNGAPRKKRGPAPTPNAAARRRPRRSPRPWPASVNSRPGLTDPVERGLEPGLSRCVTGRHVAFRRGGSLKAGCRAPRACGRATRGPGPAGGRPRACRHRRR